MREEAVKAARDAAQHARALEGPTGATLHEANTLVDMLDGRNGTTDDAHELSLRVMCAVHDLVCARENKAQEAVMQRATEATHGAAGDISALLRAAIAKQAAPENHESVQAHCRELVTTMVTRALQLDDPATLQQVSEQCEIVRNTIGEFLGGIDEHVESQGAVDRAKIDTLKQKVQASSEEFATITS